MNIIREKKLKLSRCCWTHTVCDPSRCEARTKAFKSLPPDPMEEAKRDALRKQKQQDRFKKCNETAHSKFINFKAVIKPCPFIMKGMRCKPNCKLGSHTLIDTLKIPCIDSRAKDTDRPVRCEYALTGEACPFTGCPNAGKKPK